MNNFSMLVQARLISHFCDFEEIFLINFSFVNDISYLVTEKEMKYGSSVCNGACSLSMRWINIVLVNTVKVSSTCCVVCPWNRTVIFYGPLHSVLTANTICFKWLRKWCFSLEFFFFFPKQLTQMTAGHIFFKSLAFRVQFECFSTNLPLLSMKWQSQLNIFLPLWTGLTSTHASNEKSNTGMLC